MLYSKRKIKLTFFFTFPGLSIFGALSKLPDRRVLVAKQGNGKYNIVVNCFEFIIRQMIFLLVATTLPD